MLYKSNMKTLQSVRGMWVLVALILLIYFFSIFYIFDYLSKSLMLHSVQYSLLKISTTNFKEIAPSEKQKSGTIKTFFFPIYYHADGYV